MADAFADDGSRLGHSEVTQKLRDAMRILQAIATTGDTTIDGEMLEAEQALRRAISRLSRR